MSKILLPGCILLAAALGFGAAWLLLPKNAPDEPSAAKKDPEKHDDHQHIRLSPQARANLGLRVDKVALVSKPFWRTLKLSGLVAEQPGSCERLVTSPLAGIVKQVGAVPNEVVRPGQTLFTIEIVSDQLIALQGNLFKTGKEVQISQQEKDRLADAFKTGAIPQTRMIEVENQLKRLQASADALEHELKVRGFSIDDIGRVRKGQFLTQITIPAPPFSAGAAKPLQLTAVAAHDEEHAYEVEEMKVLLGEQVQAGQALCLLADHHHLVIEGNVFASEAHWIQKAAHQNWPVQAEFAGDTPADWKNSVGPLQIAYLGNRMDAASQTLRFFLNLNNQEHEFERNGKKYRLWRFRPGQRVQLEIPVESFTNVFQVPAEAIAREGADTFVFLHEGEFFERSAVHVVHEDRKVALIANDGSLKAGQSIAMNAAVQLNWAAKTAVEGDHGHDHHGHSH